VSPTTPRLTHTSAVPCCCCGVLADPFRSTANACLVIGAMAGSAVVAVYVAMEGFITSRAVLWLVIQGVLIVSRDLRLL
jgi:hypothetical protein